MRRFVLALLCGLPATALAHGADAVGGGWTENGILGAYYPNPKLTGEPAFGRRDVRLDFRWAVGQPVGGSPAEPYASFPKRNFSVRWEGALLPKHSEPYVFEGVAGGGLRIRLRTKDGDETVVVDRWERSGPFRSKPVSLDRGVPLDVVIEYVQPRRTGRLRLSWKSPSTPLEVIDPIVQQGLNAATLRQLVWADSVKANRFWDSKNGDESLGPLGFPTRDGTDLVISESDDRDSHVLGRHRVFFEGHADVHQSCCCKEVVFEHGKVKQKRSIPEEAYNPKTNETVASFVATCSRIFLQLTDKAGVPDDQPFVRNFKVMRPLFPGSDEAHRRDEIVSRTFKPIVRDYYTAIRWLQVGNVEGEDRWADRNPPDYAHFHGLRDAENWEYLVILANETGKDLILTTPIGVDDAYFEKLARLLRYGSDGREPYSKPTANPVYPPLNSNLRVYFEVGNEIWNWAFPSTTKAQRLTREAKNTPLWSILDFDGKIEDPSSAAAMRRWHAFRTVRASQAFRRVFGDEGMGRKFRPLIGYQYANYQNTAESSFDFLDAWLWHRAEADDRTPVPVSHWIWGGGGASYYGVQNPRGVVDGMGFSDPSFEVPALSTSKVQLGPQEASPWTFEAAAGLVRLEEEGPVGPLKEPPLPKDGKQTAILFPGGAFSQSVQFEEPGHYAVVFRFSGPSAEEGWPPHLGFDVEVDGERLTPRRQIGVEPGKERWSGNRWMLARLQRFYGSRVFEVAAPGEKTITFRASAEGANMWLMVDEVQLARAENIASSGFDIGEAEGQVGSSVLGEQFQKQATFSRAFGLPVVAYEAGWAVGGDRGQVPIQSWAKFNDPGVGTLNDRMIDLWFGSGSFLNVWGVYTFFPEREPRTASERPLMKSLLRSTRKLPADAVHGRPIPTRLTVDEADWSVDGEQDSIWDRLWGETGRRWWAWMLVAPKAGRHVVELNGSGSVRVELDGEVILSGEKRREVVFLTRGAHGLRAAPDAGGQFENVSIRPE